MSNGMIIYQIRLPKNQNLAAFVEFMEKEYFPAVHKDATRMGVVSSLTLLQGDPQTADAGLVHHFFLHVGWGGLRDAEIRVDDEKVVRKFREFNPDFKRLGFFSEVFAWKRESAG